MRRNKSSAKQSGPTTIDWRQVAYDREICITICRRYLAGEDLQVICAKPPMPIGPVFLGWVQDHQEAREIYRSALNFLFDRALAKIELDVAWMIPVTEWEQEVRTSLELGRPVDYLDRKYILPDWGKVYALIGGPPVWSTEDMQAYNALLGEFTQMLQPCDVMELIWTKEGADATWELGREAREKNALPERQYQLRLQNLAQLQRQAPVEAKPATAFDHSLGLRAGFKYHQGLDAAQTRAIKRRDNALRQIARWRDGLGGKARTLSDKFVAELALAERYGVAPSLGAEIDGTAGEAAEAALPLAQAGEAAQAATADASAEAAAVASSDEAVQVAPTIASADGAAEAAPPRASSGKVDIMTELIDWLEARGGSQDYPTESGLPEAGVPPAGAAEAASPVASSGEAAEAAPAVAAADEATEAAPAVAPAGEAVEAAPPRAPAGEVAIDTDSLTEPINWDGWLRGAQIQLDRVGERRAEELQAEHHVEAVACAQPRGGSQACPAGSGLPGAGAVSSGD
jgi:hypothetical protein